KDGFGPGVQFVALHHHGGLSGNLELELAHREVQIKIEVLQHGADRCDLQVLPWHFDASGLSTDGSTRSWNVLDTELAPGGNCLSIGKGTRSGNGHFPTGSGVHDIIAATPSAQARGRGTHLVIGNTG